MFSAWSVKYGFVTSSLTFLVRERGDNMLDLIFLLIEIMSLIIQFLEFKNSYRTRNTVVIIFVIKLK